LNTSVQRTFPIHENLQLDFRVEAFNILNHPNFGQIDANLPDATFGQSLGTYSIGSYNPLYAMGAPRSLQLSLRIKF
jgi:hypothetical protein